MKHKLEIKILNSPPMPSPEVTTVNILLYICFFTKLSYTENTTTIFLFYLLRFFFCFLHLPSYGVI